MEIDLAQLRATSVEFSVDQLIVTLRNGQTISTPLAWYPKLLRGSASDRMNYRLTAMGISWPELNEDLSVAGMIVGNRSVDFDPKIDPAINAPGMESDLRDIANSISRAARASQHSHSDISRHVYPAPPPAMPRRNPSPVARELEMEYRSDRVPDVGYGSRFEEILRRAETDKVVEGASDWKLWLILALSASAAVLAFIAAAPIIVGWLMGAR